VTDEITKVISHNHNSWSKNFDDRLHTGRGKGADIPNRMPVDTHTHSFNGPFSGTTRVSQYQKGKPIWILLEQETVDSVQENPNISSYWESSLMEHVKISTSSPSKVPHPVRDLDHINTWYHEATQVCPHMVS